ncbi:MAG: peptide-methionine (S)-S-oxide reductase MsrA [Eubacteriales bacterium]
MKTIYLAGGCFWGVERLMHAAEGVISATSGYANGGTEQEANYKEVCKGTTGFKETVRVIYNPKIITLEELLLRYFYVIDPSVKNRQAGDIGTQYQTGIYYEDEESRVIVERIVSIEASGVEEFFVEIEELKNFYEAEEYHQKYLEKNPTGYCHIPFEEIDIFNKITIKTTDYIKPSKDIVGEKSLLL